MSNVWQKEDNVEEMKEHRRFQGACMQTSAMLQIDAVDGEKPKMEMMALNRVAIIRRVLSLKLTQYPRGRIPRNFSVYGTNAGAASNTSTVARDAERRISTAPKALFG